MIWEMLLICKIEKSEYNIIWPIQIFIELITFNSEQIDINTITLQCIVKDRKEKQNIYLGDNGLGSKYTQENVLAIQWFSYNQRLMHFFSVQAVLLHCTNGLFFLYSTLSTRRILSLWVNALPSLSSRLLPTRCREVLLLGLSLLRNYNLRWCHIHHRLLQ